MSATRVTDSAEQEFLFASSAIVATSGLIRAKVECSIKCHRMRSDSGGGVGVVSVCNGFTLDPSSGQCHLGFMDPNCILREQRVQGDEGEGKGQKIIYFDVNFF